MILLSVTKTFQNMLVLKILNEGFMVNQHSKIIIKLKLELLLHLALQQYILSESAFVQKDSYARYLSCAILGSSVPFWELFFFSYCGKTYLADVIVVCWFCTSILTLRHKFAKNITERSLI